MERTSRSGGCEIGVVKLSAFHRRIAGNGVAVREPLVERADKIFRAARFQRARRVFDLHALQPQERI